MPPLYQCQVGYYCPGGTANQIPCKLNEMANRTLSVKCDPCPAGFYCLKTGQPLACKRGFYCPAGTGVDLQPCPRGTYGASEGFSDVSQCTPCDFGNYCGDENTTSASGNCSEGYWCYSGIDKAKPYGGNTSFTLNSSCYDTKIRGYGGICPVGSYCPQGSGLPTPCTIGTYAPVEGLGTCYQCVKGYYCPETNMTSYDSYPCPEGHYCLNGTRTKNQYPCPVGTYSDQVKKTKVEDCIPCPPGKYCPQQG